MLLKTNKALAGGTWPEGDFAVATRLGGLFGVVLGQRLHRESDFVAFIGEDKLADLLAQLEAIPGSEGAVGVLREAIDRLPAFRAGILAAEKAAREANSN